MCKIDLSCDLIIEFWIGICDQVLGKFTNIGGDQAQSLADHGIQKVRWGDLIDLELAHGARDDLGRSLVCQEFELGVVSHTYKGDWRCKGYEEIPPLFEVIIVMG